MSIVTFQDFVRNITRLSMVDFMSTYRLKPILIDLFMKRAVISCTHKRRQTSAPRVERALIKS
jgi:hypothetical protein